jgi:hypothetical protein
MTEVVFEDSEWKLKRDPKFTGVLEYWLAHQCEDQQHNIQRYFTIISDPCGYCGSTCPEGLQGLYLMLEYL